MVPLTGLDGPSSTPWGSSGRHLVSRGRRLAPRSALVGALSCWVVASGCGQIGERTDGSGTSAEPATEAQELIARSIAHHDPEGLWPGFHGELRLSELRPDGAGRSARVSLDVRSGSFRYSAVMDGRDVLKVVADGRCEAMIDGEPPDSPTSERLRLSCDQLERSRNYYLYLWGLPMKLRDPGAIVHPDVTLTDFQGRPVLSTKVTYDPDVGSDTWYFYFDPETAALVGYRFYHDEAAGDGEYITLEGLVNVGSMRIPARRRWFTNAEDRFLGEDVLESATVTG